MLESGPLPFRDLFGANRSLPTVYRSLFTVHSSLFTVHCLLLTNLLLNDSQLFDLFVILQPG